MSKIWQSPAPSIISQILLLIVVFFVTIMAQSIKLIDLLKSGYKKHSRSIQQELQYGGNPNFVHHIYGVSAMHLASGQGDEATRLLMLYGGDPNIISVEGLTPLHVAASWGDSKTLQLLLESGADVNIQDQDGKTAYDLAVESQNVECAQILRCHVMKTMQKKLTSLGYVDQEKTTTAFDNCENVIHHRNVNEFELPLRLTSDTITERVYKYLEEGKHVCFDATSPNNPMLVIKQAAIADDSNHNCAYQEHVPRTSYNRFQELQDTRVQNISLSPESHSGYKRSTSIYDHCTCIHNSQGEVNCTSISHPHSHVYQMCTSKHCDAHSSNICSHCDLHTPGHPVACTRPQKLHESYRNPSFPEGCGQTNCNTRSSFCKHDCHLHSVTLPSGVKSSSSFHKDTTSSSVINRECIQVGARRHCCNVAHIDTAAMKHQDCHTTDFSIKPPVCRNCNTSFVNNVNSQYRYCACSPSKDRRQCERDTTDFSITAPTIQNCKTSTVSNVTSQFKHGVCSPSNDRKHQKESLYFNKHMFLAHDSSSDASEVSAKSYLTEVSECEYEQQGSINKLQERFSSAVNFDDASSKDKQMTPLSDYFSTELSEPHGSPTRTEYDHVPCPDRDSGITFASGKLFPPLLDGSVQSSCFGGSILSFPEMRDNCQTKTGNSLKKAKRKSLLKPQETASPLPKSHMKPQERVAEFILSVQNYMSSNDCSNDSFAGNISPTLTRSDKSTQFAEGQEEKSVYHAHQAENVNKMVPRPCAVLNTSESSVDTFATCDEGYSDTTTNVNAVNETEPQLSKTSSTQEKMVSENLTEFIHVQKHATENSPSKWKPPVSVLPDDDIMTSDDSFVRKPSARIYRMKIKHNIARHNDGTAARGKQPHTFCSNELSVSKHETSPVLYEEITQKDTLAQMYPARRRLSSDSLFSSVSVKEYVYKDKEKNITFIERHIPSDYGSSVGRRSLDSTHSKRTIDSEATLIYDWQALNEVLRTENFEAKPRSFSVSDNQCATVCGISCPDKNVASLQENNSDELSPGENVSCTTEDDDGENVATVIIPAHLENMTCQEISQELQKYGEIPGPVIPATRQVYLRRLTTLQSNPGLVVLSKACPDYPNEMRQALNGQFDISGLAELECDMVDVFNIPKNGRSWREGTEKSSFTYLLLDPRITENLPLRSKNLSDLEVFKTFICSIFYIGKGKRSRPYCHLYEAVSKMNKVNAKMNAKVKQIIEIWNAGRGVVSLHCFQSVIPVEAYTREACMIQAIGLHKLTNMKQGDLYGAALSWTAAQRRKMGVYLLRKALQIFLAEGERQICLPDLKSNQS